MNTRSIRISLTPEEHVILVEGLDLKINQLNAEIRKQAAPELDVEKRQKLKELSELVYLKERISR